MNKEYKEKLETLQGMEFCNCLKEYIEHNEQLEQENNQLKEQVECLIKQRDDINKNATEHLEKNIDYNHIVKELRSWLEEQKDYLTKIDGQGILLKDDFEFCSMNELYQTGKYSGLSDTLNKLNEIEGGKND